MNINKLAVLITFIVISSIAQAAKDKYDPIRYNHDPLVEELHRSREGEIVYAYSWRKFRDLPSKVKSFLGGLIDPECQVLIGSFNFLIPKQSKDFKKSMFTDPNFLSELSGMSYEAVSPGMHKIEFSPYPSKTITAVSTTKFSDNSQNFRDLFLFPFSEGLWVHSKSSGFSELMLQADIITHMISEGTGSRVTVLSFGILSPQESKSFRLGIVKNAMTSKMIAQIQKTPSVYTRY
jgi:hypothetical protein